ncbi:homocysteine S-methyltransferase, partial [Streptomyces venezuelae]|uniref:homocysteine S-methyltransferase n=1 Tax=Streptomyces venezuelae TaxID=54571 RepID=UPI001F33C9DF
MRPVRTLAEALGDGALVLDGGLSNQLEAQGCDLSDALWSARLLADGPEQIEAAHAAYVRAGARVLITSSYQATVEGFARRGVGRAAAERLLARSVELARAAARGVREEVWVAASVGPYGAMLADGSEYRGRYGLSVRELEAFHRPRIEVLAAAEPDVLALETVPDAEEAEALLRAAEGCGVPVWLSYTCL